MDRSPALVVPVGDLNAEARDRLLALLADHDLVAIHEDDLVQPRVWTVHFASDASRKAAAAALQAEAEFASILPEWIDVEDGDWARKTQVDLPAIQVGGRHVWRVEATELEKYIQRMYAQTRARAGRAAPEPLPED